MKIESVWEEGFRSETSNTRGHRVTVDLPPEKEGSDTGPTALELSAMALAGCVTTIFALIAGKRGLAFEGLRADLEADQTAGAPTIDRLKGPVTVETDAPMAEVEVVHRLTMERCPVGVLFEQAHVLAEWRIRTTPGPSAGPSQ